MKLGSAQGVGSEGIEIPMTPMIDVVFQLLSFFLMTFKIVSPEGDFNIKMPLAAPSPGKADESQLPPTKITLRADDNGVLNGILLGNRAIKSRQELQREIRAMVNDAGGAGSAGALALEVELDCDYQLRFEYVIDAITDISGLVTADGRIVKLIEKVKFSPPRVRQ
jgi:biopolymer transport protein ExbD